MITQLLPRPACDTNRDPVRPPVHDSSSVSSMPSSSEETLACSHALLDRPKLDLFQVIRLVDGLTAGRSGSSARNSARMTEDYTSPRGDFNGRSLLTSTKVICGLWVVDLLKRLYRITKCSCWITFIKYCNCIFEMLALFVYD